jgi:uncharacterized protein (TIGR02300 family)
MAKADLGTKRACPSCAAKFYDLGRRPIRCPKCETEFDPDAVKAVAKPRAATKAKADDKPADPVSEEKDGFEDEAENIKELDVEAATIPVGGDDSDADGDSEDEPASDDDDIDPELAEGFNSDDSSDDENDDTKLLIDEEEDEGFGEINIAKDEDL